MVAGFVLRVTIYGLPDESYGLWDSTTVYCKYMKLKLIEYLNFRHFRHFRQFRHFFVIPEALPKMTH